MNRDPQKEPIMNLRELDHRSGNGIDVFLLWSPSSDALTVFVVDEPAGDSFAFTADAADALDAFHHPYAYAAARGVTFASASREPVYA
jgi:hypothetical protein